MISSPILASSSNPAFLLFPPLRHSPTCHVSSSAHCRLRLRSPSCAAAPPAIPPAALTATPAATLYDVLGVPVGASGREIKAAYRRLALACHPDSRRGAAAASADELFVRVNDAYATLSDPRRRAEYDCRLILAAAGGRRWYATTPPTPTPPRGFYSLMLCSAGSRRRTWETDQCW